VALSPAGGGQVTQGSAVRLNVSSGTGQRPSVAIPNVTGTSVQQYAQVTSYVAT
jgi:beta-lactam-binding protein with PASTA domain